jgi:hypothetical protein
MSSSKYGCRSDVKFLERCAPFVEYSMALRPQPFKNSSNRIHMGPCENLSGQEFST